MPDAALDATADALTARALAALPADRPHGLDDLGALAPPLARLLEARLEAAVEAAAPGTAWIEPDEAVREAAEAWRAAARGAVRVPAEAWAPTVREAATLALGHLVRPAETLAEAAFRGEDGPVAVGAAVARVRAVSPYPYLPEVAERYAVRKGLERIDREGLERLLERIDRRMVSAFGPDDWLTLLGPLFELVGPASRPAGAAPTAILRPLFRAKDADALADTLEGIDAVTPADLRGLLASVLTPVGPEPGASTPAPETPSPATPPPPPDAPASGTADEAPAPARPSDLPDRPVATEPPDLRPPPLPDVAEGVRPPVIGSKYAAPEYDDDDPSEVLGPARPASAPDGPDGPMGEVRDALAQPDDDRGAPPAPPVPVLDLPDAEPADDEPAREDDGVLDVEARDVDLEDSEGLEAPAPEAPPVAGPAPVRFPPIPRPDSDEEPRWKWFARETDEPPGAPRDPEPADQNPADEEPLWKRFAQSDLAARLPDGDAPGDGSLEALEARVLGPGARAHRDAYVAELFDGAADDYRRTLEQIGRASTYSEATAVISREVLRSHSVDPYTDRAVAFIDAVQAGFERR